VRGKGSGAGASAWARYRMLSGEHRHERILVRFVLAGAGGILVAALAELWAGLATAVILFAAHAIYLRSRPGPATSWRQGALAERRTGRRLATLDPAAFHVLHDRVLPDAPTANLDHLVIGLTGVYTIASRRWNWGVRLWADHRRIWAGRRSLTGLQATAAQAAKTVAEVLAAELDQVVDVFPLVAVHGARLPRGGLERGGVILQPVRRLPRFLDGRPVIFTGAEVAAIVAAAERVLPPMLGEGPYRYRAARQ
jgi:hypothetical protein